MGLPSGTTLGPYEILEPLGAGGMGEVYRARDTRLGREVAVKILPAEFADDPDRLRRFEQEARAVAALNHPNILAVYDAGTCDGAPYLVLELLEGETLKERLDRGPMPVRKALEMMAQAARGVAAAHGKGIIHRDLKPANIFLTNDSRVKVLDFGLAKLSAGSPHSDETQVTELTRDTATAIGVVLGTVGYMSPEQVRGKPADARSDIFALGTILYEMLSGRRVFQKDSSAETMAAILHEDPPELSGGERKIPVEVARAVRHCLEKNPAERFQSAQDLSFALESAIGGSASGAVARSAENAAWSRRAFAAMAAIVALAVGLSGGWFAAHRSSAFVQPTFLQVTFERGLIYSARFAADGQTIYYSASWDGQPIQVYSTNPNSPESRNLGFENASLFAVSPSELGISTACTDMFIGICRGTLALAPLSGGAPRNLESQTIAADWTADGKEMAVARIVEGNFEIEFPLGKVIYSSESWINYLRISPDANSIAFVQYPLGAGDAGQAVVLSRDGKEIARSKTQFISVEGLAWAPNGKEVWFGATPDHAWADAIHALSLSGKERVVLRLPGMLRLHDISRDGRILLSKEVWRTRLQFRGPGDAAERDLSWLDAAVAADLSADGKTLAFGEYGEGGRAQLVAYMRKTDGSPAVKLGRGYIPALSPDQNWMLVNIFGPTRLAALPTGAGDYKMLDPGAIQLFSMLGWTPDGKEIYFAGNDGREWKFYMQDLQGGKPRPITPGILVHQPDYQANFMSHDGKNIFARDLKGEAWIYPVAGGEKIPAKGVAPGDLWANWSDDGKSAYVYQDKRTFAELLRVDLATGARRLVTKLRPDDPGGVVGIVPVRITPDGKSYAYSYNRALSDLYLVGGVK